jgi:hypothetical protein
MRSASSVGRGSSKIGVVYLAWHDLGPDCFRRFADSYHRHPAGCAHDLIVIYAGFDQRQKLQEAASIFGDTPHIAIEIPEIKFDIGYYLETSDRVPHDYLCFLNTYTELNKANWLAHLSTHALRDGVGLVGATGSYESLQNSFGLYQKISWVCATYGNKISEATAHYFGFYLKDACPNATVDPATPLPRQRINRWTMQTAQFLRQREQDIRFQTLWGQLTAPGMVFADYARFPAFPNPHIRTNGFMLQRLRLAPIQRWPVQSKLDTCAFESGTDGLTAHLRRAGLSAIAVANDGKGYDVPDWSDSETFRLGTQSGLILTDNRTREFDRMSPSERLVHVRITWGDYSKQPAPTDFPDFGYRFGKSSLSPTRAGRVHRAGSLESDPYYRIFRFGLHAMRVATLMRSPDEARAVLRRKIRSMMRGIVRAALPPFRRLDDKVAEDVQMIARLEAEIASLRNDIRLLKIEKADLQ